MASSENTEVITTRVTPRVKAILQSEAQRLGLTDAAYVRVLLYERARDVVMNINTMTEQKED